MIGDLGGAIFGGGYLHPPRCSCCEQRHFEEIMRTAAYYNRLEREQCARELQEALKDPAVRGWFEWADHAPLL